MYCFNRENTGHQTNWKFLSEKLEGFSMNVDVNHIWYKMNLYIIPFKFLYWPEHW